MGGIQVSLMQLHESLKFLGKRDKRIGQKNDIDGYGEIEAYERFDFYESFEDKDRELEQKIKIPFKC